MTATVLVAAVLLLVLLWVIATPQIRERRRERIREVAFPDAWRVVLRARIPLYARLPEQLKKQLEDDIKVFVAEKQFVGCGELEVTDEIRVTVAAQACMLTLNRRKTYYPRLATIYIYPTAYISRNRYQDESGVLVDNAGVNLGESWGDGRLVLAWDAAKHGAVNIQDGHNVVMHEFAHQLDQADGSGDGVPALDTPTRYAQWVNVLGARYEQLRKRKKSRGVIDTYGATNPAEFFSTATEAFFEKPDLMKRRMPDLYGELRDYYRVDPAEW
jgi:MtfA peptidase